MWSCELLTSPRGSLAELPVSCWATWERSWWQPRFEGPSGSTAHFRVITVNAPSTLVSSGSPEKLLEDLFCNRGAVLWQVKLKNICQAPLMWTYCCRGDDLLMSGWIWRERGGHVRSQKISRSVEFFLMVKLRWSSEIISLPFSMWQRCKTKDSLAADALERRHTCSVTSVLQGSTCRPSHQPPRPYSHVPCSFGTAPSLTRRAQPRMDPVSPTRWQKFKKN